MKLRDRIGVDISRRLKLEDAIEWAAKNGLRHIDIQLDTGENALPKFDAKRCAGVRKLLDKHGIELGLHTNSAVNVAEYSPHRVRRGDRVPQDATSTSSRSSARAGPRCTPATTSPRTRRRAWRRAGSG